MNPASDEPRAVMSVVLGRLKLAKLRATRANSERNFRPYSLNAKPAGSGKKPATISMPPIGSSVQTLFLKNYLSFTPIADTDDSNHHTPSGELPHSLRNQSRYSSCAKRQYLSVGYGERNLIIGEPLFLKHKFSYLVWDRRICNKCEAFLCSTRCHVKQPPGGFNGFLTR